MTLDDVDYYLQTGITRNGVLGPSWFGSLKYYDLIRGTAVDYMHSCLLGVVRRLLNLWLNSQNHNKTYYIGHLSTLIDRRLLSIKPITELSRAPRPVSDRKHWKASEFRSFLLYYSLPVLKDVLPENNFKHFILLVTTMRKLLGTSIEEKDLQLCTKFMNIFCKHYNELYGDQEMTINIHCLLHLVDTVRDLGPLWIYSCFFFESLNGVLLKRVHGTQGIGLQFVSNFSTLQAFPLPNDMPPIENTPHFLKLITKSASCSLMEMKGLGKAESSRLTTDESAALKCAEYVLDVVTVRRFTRLQVKGRVFDSLSWHESQRRHNSTIKFTIDSCEQIGQIKTFVELTDSNGIVHFFAFVQVLQCSSFSEATVSGLYMAEHTSTVIAVNAINIIDKCMFMQIEDKSYVSEIIDPFERD